MSFQKPVIAIDGFSSCGKSTVAKALAKRLGLRYIDSGAMYRAVTYYFLTHGIPLNESDRSGSQLNDALDAIHLDFRVVPDTGISEVYLNGTNIEKEIRSMQISANVSAVSAIPEVRHRMVALQQQMRKDGSIVMDGRDIGTTVFPDADLKIFMTADPDIRAQRRYLEMESKGIPATKDEILANLTHRDYEDQNRKESPLRKAEDAIVLDNTHMDYDQQLEFVIHELERLSESTGKPV